MTTFLLIPPFPDGLTSDLSKPCFEKGLFRFADIIDYRLGELVLDIYAILIKVFHEQPP